MSRFAENPKTEKVLPFQEVVTRYNLSETDRQRLVEAVAALYEKEIPKNPNQAIDDQAAKLVQERPAA